MKTHVKIRKKHFMWYYRPGPSLCRVLWATLKVLPRSNGKIEKGSLHWIAVIIFRRKETKKVNEKLPMRLWHRYLHRRKYLY